MAITDDSDYQIGVKRINFLNICGVIQKRPCCRGIHRRLRPKLIFCIDDGHPCGSACHLTSALFALAGFSEYFQLHHKTEEHQDGYTQYSFSYSVFPAMQELQLQ